ncbi:MAG: iron-sulfur cluster assembly protein [Alphaproteobacteria bacterium]|nr:iron-sulfur cluster assembly protein [Alphaproteobacteria bacterium]MCL2889945.1 iron-sulfur cluster assembly protein [Alphaproteobacteria bacterium]
MSFTKDDIFAALKTVFDPEIPVNVVDLGLIYDVEISDSVIVKMTLTSPTCPMAEEIVQMVKMAAESVAGAGNVNVELVWDPPWSLDKMSTTARLELDLTEEGW